MTDNAPRIPKQCRRTLASDAADALYLIVMECVDCGDLHAFEFPSWLMSIVTKNEAYYNV